MIAAQQVSFREHADEIREVVDAVFSSMLEMHARPVDREWQGGEHTLLSAVHITGSWSGVVMLECSLAVACSMTEVLTSAPCPNTLDETVRDALEELTNTVGGNLKGILPRGVRLGLAFMVEGAGCRVWFKDGEPVCRLAFESDAGAFWLHVFEMQHSPSSQYGPHATIAGSLNS